MARLFWKLHSNGRLQYLTINSSALPPIKILHKDFTSSVKFQLRVTNWIFSKILESDVRYAIVSSLLLIHVFVTNGYLYTSALKANIGSSKVETDAPMYQYWNHLAHPSKGRAGVVRSCRERNRFNSTTLPEAARRVRGSSASRLSPTDFDALHF